MSIWDAHYLFIYFFYFYFNRSPTVDPSLLGAKRGLAAARTQWESVSHPAQGVGEGGNNSPESPCVESGLFLVGSASLAISVSGRAERSGGEAAAAAAAAALEGDGLFLLCNLPPESLSHFLFCFLSSPSTPHRFCRQHKRNSS